MDVDVSATAIINGEEVVGHSYLGGHYIKPCEPLNDISGYLPQILEEAASNIFAEIPVMLPLHAEAKAARDFLRVEMRQRYDKQSEA